MIQQPSPLFRNCSFWMKIGQEDEVVRKGKKTHNFWSSPHSASPECWCSQTLLLSGCAWPSVAEHMTPSLLPTVCHLQQTGVKSVCTGRFISEQEKERGYKNLLSPVWNSRLLPPFHCIKCQRACCCGHCTLRIPMYWDTLSCFSELDTPVTYPWFSWRKEVGQKSDEDRIIFDQVQSPHANPIFSIHFIFSCCIPLVIRRETLPRWEGLQDSLKEPTCKYAFCPEQRFLPQPAGKRLMLCQTPQLQSCAIHTLLTVTERTRELCYNTPEKQGAFQVFWCSSKRSSAVSKVLLQTP